MACKTKSKGDNGAVKLTEEQEKILKAIASQDGPVTTKEIAEATGIASKSVSCRIQSLKKKGLINSPARCKYEITDTGRSVATQ
jgi:Mn-dependent DtxR family transcriptional regulator